VGAEALAPEEEGPRLPPLLDLDREHRIRVRGRLRLAAADALAGFVRDPEERSRIEAHPVRLPEAAFERRGRPREAAALYALEHDQLPKDAAEPLLGAALRYPLARALFRVGGRIEAGIGHETARAAAVMTSVLALLEPPAAGAPEAERSLAGRLSFHAREWLGLRHYEAGRYREAVGEFLRAAEAAPDTDLELAARIFAANALIRAGDQDEARKLLDGVRERAAGMSRDVSEEWDAVWRRLLEARPDEEEE
jgi:tetratricopeptide (TPR) repeat protein